MFYVFDDVIREVDFAEAAKGRLYAGWVTAEEIPQLAAEAGFQESTALACQTAGAQFRSAVEIYGDHTFTELRVADPENPEADDCMALYLRKNGMILVDVVDIDRSTIQKFERAVHRFNPGTMTLERLVYAFFDELMARDVKYIEDLGEEVSALEEDVISEKPGKDFNQDLLRLKKRLQQMHNLYEQYLDILEALDADENDIFEGETLLYLMNLEKRITRLREDVDSIADEVVHVQDACRSMLDMKMNRNMNYLTVIGTIFFPLTIIVGWYGMNFISMPEFTWKYGYVYVILLSIVIVVIAYLIAKKKKWF